ncbi:MAG TPA: GNAT family N-acetyltransferase [Clostridiaceae bacterium]
MYSLSNIKGNIQIIKEFNTGRTNFNPMNKDLFSIYNDYNFIKKIILRKQVSLLLYGNIPIGYIWSERISRKEYKINSMYVSSLNPEEGYRYLLNSFKYLNKINYNCELNNYNYTILKNLNFKRLDGTLRMCLDIDEVIPYTIDRANIEPFEKNKDQELRCSIQNSIFHNMDRTPLSVEDIISDLIQDYYIEAGGLFIKNGQEYVGYGQLIKDEEVALIVNFGIIDKFRKNGFGKMLLYNLIKTAKQLGYTKVFIKLNSNNTPAYNLYKSVGFKISKQNYNFQLYKI